MVSNSRSNWHKLLNKQALNIKVLAENNSTICRYFNNLTLLRECLVHG